MVGRSWESGVDEPERRGGGGDFAAITEGRKTVILSSRLYDNGGLFKD